MNFQSPTSVVVTLDLFPSLKPVTLDHSFPPKSELKVVVVGYDIG